MVAKDEFLKKQIKDRLRIAQNLLEWGESARVGCKSKDRTHIAKVRSDRKVLMWNCVLWSNDFFFATTSVSEDHLTIKHIKQNKQI